MTAIEGYECDQCHCRKTQPYVSGRMPGSPPEPKTGWFVMECPTNGSLKPLWFCAADCAIKWLKAR